MTVEIRTHIGQLPPFWDRNAVFFANLFSLFFGNDGQTDELYDVVKGVRTYGGRLVPILNLIYRGAGRNLLQIEAPPDPALTDYFTRELGLALPEIKVLSRDAYGQLGADHNPHPRAADLAELRRHPAPFVDGFVIDDDVHALAGRLDKTPVCPPQASRTGNNKLLLHRHMKESGAPVLETCIASNLAEVEQGRQALIQKGYRRFVVKAQIGASGIGLFHGPTDRPVQSIPDHLFFEGPALVQGWLDGSVPGVEPLGSPSVQLFLHDDYVSLYDLTEQLLGDQSIHQGNLAPPPLLAENAALRDEVLAQARTAAGWLHEQGYRGTASVDFLVVRRDGHPLVHACEINARVTGATYPAVLARHLNTRGAWLMRNTKLTEPLPSTDVLKALDAERLLFRPGMQRGVLPINFNQNDNGLLAKIQFLYLADDVDGCFELLERTTQRLPTGSYDERD